MIFHYTTMATIYNMLSAYKDSTDKDNLVFWASNALNQNDTEELSLELDNILEVICELESKGEELSDIYKLSTFKNYTWIPEITGQIQKNLEELLKTKEFIPYTISFSNAEDKLIMWSMYANNGNGICLAFDEQTLVNQKRDLKVVSGNVVYQKTSDTFKKEIKEIVDMFHDEVKNERILQDIHFKKNKYLMALLRGISPFIKNLAFKDEEEYRLAFYLGSDEVKVYSRLTNGLNIVNYIKVKIPLSALDHITIGPCADFDKTKKLLLENMRSCNIEKKDRNDFIRPSKVPYRIY